MCVEEGGGALRWHAVMTDDKTIVLYIMLHPINTWFKHLRKIHTLDKEYSNHLVSREFHPSLSKLIIHVSYL